MLYAGGWAGGGGVVEKWAPKKERGEPTPQIGPYLQKMVGREGFEPPKAKPADLQSAPFGHFGTCPKILLRKISIGENAVFPSWRCGQAAIEGPFLAQKHCH